jgi:hypothetical protein
MPPNLRLGVDQPATYRIRVKGRLDENWSDWFGGMAVTSGGAGDGPTITTLSGAVTDKAALHGLLNRIRDLGLPLLEVRCTSLEE